MPLTAAIWVEPKRLCLIEHTSWNTQYRLEQPKFLRLLDPGGAEGEKKEKRKKEQEKARKSQGNPPGRIRYPRKSDCQS